MGCRFLSFLNKFSHHFRSYRHDVSEGARQYMSGLMQGGKRKNMLHMAQVVPEADNRNLQQFLTHSKWSAREVMDHVAQEVSQSIGHDTDACLLIDESGFAKQGKKSVGVARQWLGRLGKVDNGQVAVYATLCNGERHSLVDTRLYLPKEWTDDPQRCIEAGVPEEEIVFKTKDQLALEIIQNARALGLKFGWVGADAGYGKSCAVFYNLEKMGERFFIDIPSDFSVYLSDPQPKVPQIKGLGRKPTRYKTALKSQKACSLKALNQPERWQSVDVRKTTRGRLKLRALRQTVYVWDAQREHSLKLTLLVSENPDGTERKYTMTNAPETERMQDLVYAQRQRFWVERSFENAKGQCGMADYQVQKWAAWHHHMALVIMAMYFMLEERIAQKEDYPLLSCTDIEMLLAFFLPRRDLNKEEIIRQVEESHKRRKRAMLSHARMAKKREKVHD